jgi:hypothetical protein
MKKLIQKVLAAIATKDNVKIAKAMNSLVAYAQKHPWSASFLNDQEQAVLDTVLKAAQVRA